jgi:hypothetical protein
MSTIVATEPVTPSIRLPPESTGLTPNFGGTPGFFSAEFGALNPFDADFQDATASPLPVEQPSSTSLGTPLLSYASYQRDVPRSIAETALCRNYDPSLVPTPGPRVNPFRSSTLKESVGPKARVSLRLPPSPPRGSPEALNPAFLTGKEAQVPPSYTLPPPVHSGFGSSRGIHGEVTPPITDDSHSPDDKDASPPPTTKSMNNKSSQPRKSSNPKKRKSADAETPAIKLKKGAAPSQHRSTESTPQPSEKRDEKDLYTQDSKRKKFLERNRLAASKCRQKKKEWATHLEEHARFQAQENKVLRASVAQLRDECLYLKSFLLSTHSGCRCVGVKDYFMKEAQLSQQVAAGIAAGGVMPIAGMIHPGCVSIMGMGPPMQHGMDVVAERERSQSVGRAATGDGRPTTQGSTSPEQ